MRPRADNARPRYFVVPTNSALDFHPAGHALLLFWPFTLPVLHLFFRFSSTLKSGDLCLSRHLRLSVWTANTSE